LKQSKYVCETKASSFCGRERLAHTSQFHGCGMVKKSRAIARFAHSATESCALCVQRGNANF
jgi:hypothetical protein